MKYLYRSLSWLVIVIIPIFLVLTSVRLLLTHTFVQVEYRTPAFPPDPYGFTRTDRLYWSQIAVDYLLNNKDISFLGDLKFKDGRSVYNPAELSHMVDVKNTVRGALMVWYISMAILIILGVWAWRARWWNEYRSGLRNGGWLTLVLVGLIVLTVLVGFGVFFVAFHEILFAPGTWTFEYSDTLIRLFPERFWRDSFLTVGLIALLGGFGLAFGMKRRSK
jgi:integral membrane protein (TIGR01906 family)